MDATAAAWDEIADRWAALARGDDDRAFWEVTLPVLSELLPPPPGRILDLGCAEGRLSRILRERGYSPTGVDASPAMIRLAEEADPDGQYLVADATALPYPDRSFPAIVASMSLHDIEKLNEAVSECARLLSPDGMLVFAILHPLVSAEIVGGYLCSRSFRIASRRDPDLRYACIHRPIEEYIVALTSSGLRLDALLERSETGGDRPLTLAIRAVKS